MLETLFVIGFVLIPLSIAIVLILYRARFFVIGIVGLVLLLALIWSALKVSSIIREERPVPPASRPADGRCLDQGVAADDPCRL